jgi:hypothetical protein
MTNAKPDIHLIISDLLDCAYEAAVANRDTSVLIGAAILLKEYEEKLEESA